MVRNVAHSLFFENRADELTAPGGQENRTR